MGIELVAIAEVHHERHTFISRGRTLAEVRVAAGCTNLAVTSIYLHVAVNDDDGVGDLFGAK